MTRFIIKFILWLVAGYSIWLYIGNYFSPDSCLDFGGSFDYEAWECSYKENKKYIETYFYQVPSFIFTSVSVCAAVAGSFLLRSTRRSV